jgi:hypothetical protein
MRVRQEVTVWDKTDYRVPAHIYLTSGTTLLGYVPEGSTEAIIFAHPKKQWSVARRKFRDLTKAEIKGISGI